MPMVALPDPDQVLLQVVATELDGQPKLDVVGATVRVYHYAAGEVADLPTTVMTQVGTTAVWRYVWAPAALAAGQYVVEYALVDTAGRVCLVQEDLSVPDAAQQSTLELMQADLTLVRQVEAGRWRVVANQMIFYATDGTTPILTFDLRDSLGAPTMDAVFERVPVV